MDGPVAARPISATAPAPALGGRADLHAPPRRAVAGAWGAAPFKCTGALSTTRRSVRRSTKSNSRLEGLDDHARDFGRHGQTHEMLLWVAQTPAELLAEREMSRPALRWQSIISGNGVLRRGRRQAPRRPREARSSHGNRATRMAPVHHGARVLSLHVVSTG